MGMEQTENQDVFDIAERDVFRFSSEFPDDASLIELRIKKLLVK